MKVSKLKKYLIYVLNKKSSGKFRYIIGGEDYNYRNFNQKLNKITTKSTIFLDSKYHTRTKKKKSEIESTAGIVYIYLSCSFFHLIKEKCHKKRDLFFQNSNCIYTNYKYELFLWNALNVLKIFLNLKDSKTSNLNNIYKNIITDYNVMAEEYDNNLYKIPAGINLRLIYGKNYNRIVNNNFSKFKIYENHKDSSVEYDENLVREFPKFLFEIFSNITEDDRKIVVQYILNLEKVDFTEIYDIERIFLNEVDKEFVLRLGMMLEITSRKLKEYSILQIRDYSTEYVEKIEGNTEYNKIKTLVEKCTVCEKNDIAVWQNILNEIRFELYKIYYNKEFKNLSTRYNRETFDTLSNIRRAFIQIEYIPIINPEIQKLLDELLGEGSIRTIVLQY